MEQQEGVHLFSREQLPAGGTTGTGTSGSSGIMTSGATTGRRQSLSSVASAKIYCNFNQCCFRNNIKQWYVRNRQQVDRLALQARVGSTGTGTNSTPGSTISGVTSGTASSGSPGSTASDVTGSSGTSASSSSGESTATDTNATPVSTTSGETSELRECYEWYTGINCQ
ncbi:hypothetical protein CEXT_350491 [Caerostris extrusa]|uniref:Uncharacterized protein n=1 Tax=Caerostris extrusa TaxID=172846 RepID=A0AAV4TF42_CAEEX|nr:hypothetical protein CEXT_350491 [Caerostris extrusa]